MSVRSVPKVASNCSTINGSFGAIAAITPNKSTDRYVLRIQPVDATHWLNRSAGVWKPNVFLGRSLSCLATALSLACE